MRGISRRRPIPDGPVVSSAAPVPDQPTPAATQLPARPELANLFGEVGPAAADAGRDCGLTAGVVRPQSFLHAVHAGDVVTLSGLLRDPFVGRVGSRSLRGDVFVVADCDVWLFWLLAMLLSLPEMIVGPVVLFCVTDWSMFWSDGFSNFSGLHCAGQRSVLVAGGRFRRTDGDAGRPGSPESRENVVGSGSIDGVALWGGCPCVGFVAAPVPAETARRLGTGLSREG